MAKLISKFDLLAGMPPDVRARITAEANAIQRNIDALVTRAAAAYQVTPADIRGRVRTESISEARHVAFALCRTLGMTFEQIGMEFGRDHSTVVYAIQTLNRKLKYDDQFRAIVAANFPELLGKAKAGAT